MRTLSVTAVALLLAASATPEVRQGTKTRPDAADYTVHTERDGIAIGATMLSPDQVRHTFATDLKGYVVVEVALYPKGSNTIDVAASDFTLRTSGVQTARAANPRAIAANRQKASNSPGNIDVYPQVGIGYESGPRGYDPATGNYRNGRGVYTSAGVGVGVGAPGPASTDQDRRTMELELSERSLPEGATTKPVAGYLYFPVAAKKNATYDLEYHAPSGRISLRLPAAK